MSEKNEKEVVPPTVVNEDEEIDKEVSEAGKEEVEEDTNLEGTTGKEDNHMDVEEKEEVAPRRRHNNRYRGGRGGRHGRRHVPYRNYDVEPSSSDRKKRVYVGNLSWNVSWRELKDYMKSTGCEVTRADVMTTPDGRSKGCGIVEFATTEGARRAVLTLNDTDLMGRQIFVREDREEGVHAQSRRVYVGNLAWDVAWQDLKDHMREAGDVLYAEVLMEHDGRSKGCGIVEYANASEAQEAIANLTDTELKGRMIFVREDRETSSNVSAKSTSLYVGNLAFECSWQDLKDHMRTVGLVEQANILSTEDGRSKGCGIVTYQKPQDAQRAIRELQNTILHGRPIFVREDREQQSYPLQLFVGNLSYDTNWRDLKDHFRQCGEVERAEVMEGPDGRKRGYGTVRYYRSRDAQNAIKRLNGVDFMGRRLEVRVDHKASD